jgi:hypothetical protein
MSPGSRPQGAGGFVPGPPVTSDQLIEMARVAERAGQTGLRDILILVAGGLDLGSGDVLREAVDAVADRYFRAMDDRLRGEDPEIPSP